MYILHKTFFQKQKSPHVSNVYTQNKLMVLAPCSHFCVFFSCMELAASFLRFVILCCLLMHRSCRRKAWKLQLPSPLQLLFAKLFVCVLCKFPKCTFGCLLQMKAFSALFCYKLYDPPLSSGLTPNRRWTSHMQMLPSSHTCLHTYHNINQSHHLFQLHKQNTLAMMIALVQRKKISNHELQHKPNIPSLSNYINKTYHLQWLHCAQKIGVRFDWTFKILVP